MNHKKASEPLKPLEICLGNFIESMGNIEMVNGIVQINETTWQIGHTGWGKDRSPMPDGVLYDTYPIRLTEQWKVCFGIEKHSLPEWIEYVHQVQNYYMYALNINLTTVMDWDLLPQAVDIAMG
jgi:hypothetical protein